MKLAAKRWTYQIKCSSLIVSKRFMIIFYVLKWEKKACCYGYLDGAPKEGQEVSANRQQDEHAVEVEAGGRSSGPGQSVLETRVQF